MTCSYHLHFLYPFLEWNGDGIHVAKFPSKKPPPIYSSAVCACSSLHYLDYQYFKSLPVLWVKHLLIVFATAFLTEVIQLPLNASSHRELFPSIKGQLSQLESQSSLRLSQTWPAEPSGEILPQDNLSFYHSRSQDARRHVALSQWVGSMV